MKNYLITFLSFILCSLSFAQGGTIIIGEHDFDETLKEEIVKAVKATPEMAKYYSEAMDEAFNFLDPDDPRRMSVSDIENLGAYSLSLWKPSSSFRIGQGDFSLCTDDEDLASYDLGTVLVGFDTSYKREQVYGFWAVFQYEYNWCEKEDGTVTKTRINLTFTKWLSSLDVTSILD